jgi:rubredoxin
MSDIYRNIAAVFRKYPDSRGDIQMIHNGHNKLEVDDTIEALWFDIDNHRRIKEIYQRFVARLQRAPDADTQRLFSKLIRHFAAAGFVELTVPASECSRCGWLFDPLDGIADELVPPGTAFADLPADWICPDCGGAKALFHDQDN